VTQIERLVEKIDLLTAKIETQTPPLNVDQAAAYLHVSKSYLYRMTSGALIPHYKTQGGKQLSFLRTDLDAWLTAHRIATRQEIAAEVEATR
jgi:excisionase family DNA binding protein